MRPRLSDIGKFVGRYFQILGGLSIASMVVSAILFNTLYIDFTVVLLFAAASGLVRHQPLTRPLTIIGCSLVLVCGLGLLAYGAVAGTGRIVVYLGGARIENPSLFTLAAASAATGAIVALPLALLLTPQAKREFARTIHT